MAVFYQSTNNKISREQERKMDGGYNKNESEKNSTNIYTHPIPLSFFSEIEIR